MASTPHGFVPHLKKFTSVHPHRLLAATIAVIVLLGCDRRFETVPRSYSTNAIDPWGRRSVADRPTSIASDESPARVGVQLPADRIVQIAREQALLKGLTGGEIEFQAHETGSGRWWIGIRAKDEDPSTVATGRISEDGEAMEYLPPGHTISKVDAIELAKGRIRL